MKTSKLESKFVVLKCIIYNKIYKLYLDDEYIGGIYKKDFEKVGIYLNESDLSSDNITGNDFYIENVSEESLIGIRDIIFERAYNKAVGYLSVSECSAEMIRSKLKLKGVADYVIDDVIQVLYEYRYLDDERFVENYTRIYIRSKSRHLIEIEIEERGVDVSKYSDVIDNVYEDENVTEGDVIKELLLKKYKNQNLEDIKIKRRAISFLYRHGFSYDMINNYLT